MHPKGSTCPPTPPPSLAEAFDLLIDIDGLANEYNRLTKWTCSSPAVRSVLARYKYLTKDDFQKLVDWAKALVGRLETNYRPINPPFERAPRLVYEMLKRLSESTRQDLEKVRHELATWAEDKRKIDSESRPTIPYQSLDEGSLPFHPTDEVRQLQGETTELRNRIKELEEELAEKNSLIQSLKDGKGKERE